MSLQDPTTTEGAIEECLDEMNDFVATLDRYPPTAVAVAISVHLQTVLCALVECDLCTPQQVRDFMQELERDVLAEVAERRPGRFSEDFGRPKPSTDAEDPRGRDGWMSDAIRKGKNDEENPRGPSA